MDAAGIPVWNLSDIFSDFDSERYKAVYSAFEKNIKKLEELVKRSPSEEVSVFAGELTRIIELYNETGAAHEELFSYAYCRYSTDTGDKKALSELNRIETLAVGLSTAGVILRNYLAAAGELLGQAVESSPYLKQFRFFFDEQLKIGEKQMSPEMEELAADLARSGSSSWERLQETLSASAEIEWDESTGETKTSVELRAMTEDPDEATRKKAWMKELELWKNIETPMAFALNGVKGASNSVNSRRGFESTLDRSAMQARISRKTLDAMISAMEASLPAFRKYLKLKAGLLGKKQIAFYDLFAPVSTDTASMSFDQAAEFIVRQFREFSGELADFAEQAVKNRWIDARPRKNKVGGAYCTSFHISGVSRILSNFNGSFRTVSTVAHELGHAYHNHILKDAPEIYRDYPMTLAETASIFCETLVLEGALKNSSDAEQLELIEHELMESTQIIVDILSRYLFEQRVFQHRAERELSAAEFCELMLDAQKQTYGDAMDPEYMHPYMWAAKGHYYHQELGYYNFPYAFGKLFGLGLYSRYKSEGESFVEKYREILYMTGNASAEDVTKSAGYDITTENFWRSSLETIGERIELFEKLCLDRI